MPTLPDLSKSEWIVMNALWNHAGKEGLTLAEFFEALNHKSWAIGTVRSFLVRLVNKGYAKKTAYSYGNRYSPKMSRSSAVKRAVRGFAGTVLDGDAAPLTEFLLKHYKVSKKNAQVVEKILSR